MQKRKKVSDSKNVTAKNNNKNVKAEMELKQSLVKTRNAIRKKFQDLHNVKQMISERISEVYKPIIDPIKKISDDKIKEDPEKVESTPIKKELKNESDSIFRTAPAYRRKLFATSEKKHNSSAFDEMQTDSTADVIKQKIHEHSKQYSSADKDNVFGIRTQHGELYMGKHPITVKTDDDQMSYFVKNKKFPVTTGLSDLLLMNNPPYYTNQDLDTYKDMLTLTSAHKKNYNANGIIRRPKSSVKYAKIISNLFPEKGNTKNVGGKGMQWRQRQQMKKPQTAYKTFNRTSVYDYKYWDNPNELVDRLRLLVSSQAAGHTGHNNEIIAIIEELREAKIIV